MPIEAPVIEWFNGLSPIVKCSNCVHWKRNDSAHWDPVPSLGKCEARDDRTSDEFYCKYFELNQGINV